jgi:PAS domain S-box-containing protein
VPCGYLDLASDGQILFANQPLAHLLGIPPGSLIGKNFVNLLSRGSAIFFETQFAPSLLLRRSLNEIAFDLRCSDERLEPVLANALVQRNEDSSEVIRMALFATRQRRLYEAELLRARRESEQVAEIVRKSSDAIIRCTAEGIIEHWNHGARQIFGHAIEQRLGQAFTVLFASESYANIESALFNLQAGREVELETIGLNSKGESLDVSVSLTPHMEAPGTLVAFSAIIRDITARKRGEKALIQNEKLASVGRLASSIAHEINNPLEAVTNLLYILSSRVTDSETRQFVMTAQEELARVSQITTHTLRFHKQSSGRTEVNLRSMIESVVALYRARLDGSGIDSLIDCPEDFTLSCYEGEVRQILVNLVSNAFDAMRLGGTLNVRVRRNVAQSGSTVRILVADTGCGISSEGMSRLFEPFFSTKGIGGTGLGLWITKDLVAKNGGTIRIRSSDRLTNSGTVVSLRFS